MRRVILAIVSTAAALVFLLTFKTHTASTTTGASSALAGASPGTGTGTGTASGPAASSTPASSGSAQAAAPTASAAGTGAARIVTGEAWPTIYGPVQVRITVAGGRITAVTALEYPANTPRDEQINAFAIPELNQETLTASSARIDAVSGATYTSQGYIGSLQSAVDKAGL
jgi:uncharacterized protein with FMN-binding domain